MNRRNVMLTAIGVLAIAQRTSVADEDQKLDDRLFKGVPSMTVKELSEGLQMEGYQHRFLAHQICFQCTCKPFKGESDKQAILYFEIDGLKSFPGARLFNLPEAHESGLIAGRRLDVHGLILEQNYGVWSIWVYSAKPLPVIEGKTAK